MNIFIQAIIKAILPLALSSLGQLIREAIWSFRHASTRPYIDQLFSIFLDFVRDPDTPVDQTKGESIINGLRAIVDALLSHEEQSHPEIKPWRPQGDK